MLLLRWNYKKAVPYILALAFSGSPILGNLAALCTDARGEAWALPTPERVSLKVDAPHARPGQALRQPHEWPLARGTQLSHIWIPDWQKLGKMISVWCFQLLSSEIICYTAIGDECRVTWDPSALSAGAVSFYRSSFPRPHWCFLSVHRMCRCCLTSKGWQGGKWVGINQQCGRLA